MMKTILAAISYKAPKPNVVLAASYSASAFALGSGTAIARLKIENDGDIIRNGTEDLDDWTDDKPNTVGADFEVVVNSKDAIVSGPGVGTHSLSVSREWQVTATGGEGTNTGSVNITIRQITNHSNAATTTLNLTANSEP